jgi:hypothetical protein
VILPQASNTGMGKSQQEKERFQMTKQIISYSPSCAKHSDAYGRPCAETRFKLRQERIGASNEYQCLTCEQILTGDKDCLDRNRHPTQH